MTWLTHLRTIAVGLSAFTLCCGLVTQLLARAIGFASELGPPLLDLGGLRLYAPFSFLTWSFTWASVAPSLLVLSLCLSVVCALAAYAVSILFARLEPISLAERAPWRDLATLHELRHYGLLGDEGLALGAVRHHAWATHQTVRSTARACVFLGRSEHTDDAVLAALRSWAGTLVLVDARGYLAQRLGRERALRLAPGGGDGISINPLLAIRGDLHAWEDARQLACALLTNIRAVPQTTSDAFALLMLDQLHCAPLEARTLADLRRRLIDPTTLVGNLCGRWTAQPKADAAPAIWEMLRAARAQRAEPNQALSDFDRIDLALAIFADVKLVTATSAHHLNWTEFVSSVPPQTLVVSLENIGASAAPLVHALLAQLATHCSSANDTAAMMVAIEADAARLLANELRGALPLGPNAKVLIQTTSIADAERLTGGRSGEGPIVAIGPQTDSSAESLSARASRCVVFEPMPHAIHRWRRLMFPAWIKREVERLPVAALISASPDEAFLVSPDQKPARMRVMTGGGATRFIAPTASARHDWSAPPVDSLLQPETPAPGANSLVRPGPAPTKLRRLLTRTATKPTTKGARTK